METAVVAVASCRGFRFPPEVIAHAVWLYHRFPLSLWGVEELLFERGITVSYETVRAWSERFGPEYAAQLRRQQPKPGDKWHLDEVFIKVNGRMRYLWRAVDQDGNVLDILVTDPRDTAAAVRFFRKLLKNLAYVPRVIVTDKLRSYGAAHRTVMPSVEHRSSRYLNNRCENSHRHCHVAGETGGWCVRWVRPAGGATGQAAVGQSVAWFHMVKRSVISVRYSAAVSRWRRGRK